MKKVETIEDLEKRRIEALELVEASYNSPKSPNYKDNDRYSWAVEKINRQINEDIEQLKFKQNRK